MSDLAAKAKQLYERFLAPLVLGGELTPGPAIGARDGVALDGGLSAVDPDVRSQVDVARVRAARRLVPVDTLDDPSGATWALGAALHDLDGFYTFVVGTESGFAVLRDPIACKPAVMAETDDYVAFGSEYRALVDLPGIEHAHLFEPAPARVYFWDRPASETAA